MPEFREGQTASHPDGRRIVYRNGDWVPLAPMPTQAPMAQAIEARRRGVPAIAPQDDPVNMIHDPKRRDIVRGTQIAAGTKELLKQKKGYDDAVNLLGSLKEFDMLNDRVRPNGGLPNRMRNQAAAWLGDADIDRMDQITASMARLQRQPGEGATSDFEGRMYMKMVGGRDRPYATNRAYSQAARAIAQRNVDYYKFQEQYLQANGTLNGAVNMWSRYRDANPVLDTKGNVRKVPTVNQWLSSRIDRASKYGIDKQSGKIRSAPPSTRKPANAGWTVRRVN